LAGALRFAELARYLEYRAVTIISGIRSSGRTDAGSAPTRDRVGGPSRSSRGAILRATIEGSPRLSLFFQPSSRVWSPGRSLNTSSVFLGFGRLKKYQMPSGSFICAIALPFA